MDQSKHSIPMITKVLYRNLRTRLLRCDELAAACRQLMGTKSFGRERLFGNQWHYHGFWVTDRLWNLSGFHAASQRVSVTELCRVGRLLSPAEWHGILDDSLSGMAGMIVSGILYPMDMQKPQARLSVGMDNVGGRERWLLSWSGYQTADEVAQSPGTSVAPESYRNALSPMLPLFEVNYGFQTAGRHLIADIPPQHQKSAGNLQNPETKFMISFGGSVCLEDGNSSLRSAAESITVHALDKTYIKRTLDRLLEHFQGCHTECDSWDRFFDHNMFISCLPSISQKLTPPFEISFCGNPLIEDTADSVCRAACGLNDLIPFGYYYRGSQSWTVDVVPLKSDGEGRWTIEFNLREDQTTKKSAEKAKAQLEKVINLPELFACEQLVEKYAHLCR